MLLLMSASSPGSWMGMMPCFRPSIFFGVDVDAEDVVARVRKTGTGDEADVTGAENGDSHGFPGRARKGARSGILANSPLR